VRNLKLLREGRVKEKTLSSLNFILMQRKKIYEDKNFYLYIDKVGEKYGIKIKAKPDLDIKSPEITTLVTVMKVWAMAKGQVITEIFFTPLSKINKNSQEYLLEWGMVKK